MNLKQDKSFTLVNFILKERGKCGNNLERSVPVKVVPIIIIKASD